MIDITRASEGSTATGAVNKARLLFLFAAFASFLFSVALWFTGSREEALFVGLWVPSILSLGCLLLIHRGEA